jgi:3'-5' exonuclease
MKQLNNIYLDFETYYSDTYSLKKMSTQEYITGSEFEIIGFALGIEEQVIWLEGQAEQVIRSIDWSNTRLIAHNALFDAAILHYKYGVHPAELACTMSMARATGIHLLNGASLDSVATSLIAAGYPVPPKGNEVIAANGKIRAMFSQDELDAYGKYCETDVIICRAAYKAMLPMLTQEEMQYQSTVIKMFTHPQMELDKELLAQELERVVTRKYELLGQLQDRLDVPNPHVLQSLLKSGVKFAKVLKSFGITPPTKVSKTTGETTYAFAKTDAGMQALLEHPDELVALMASVKLGTSGSIAETRTASMLSIADLGPMPFGYNIHGAHTGRVSGGAGGSLNPQNMPSGRVEGQSTALRRSIKAPQGMLTVAVDSSNLESRVLAYVANSVPKLTAFREGKDPYLLMASSMYRIPYDVLLKGKQDKDPDVLLKRQVAKSAELGCGFQAGKDAFVNYCKTVHNIDITVDESEDIVYKWRNAESNRPIVSLWKQAQRVIAAMYDKQSGYFGGADGRLFKYDGARMLLGQRCPGIQLPDGVWLNYYQLTATQGKYGPEFSYSQRKGSNLISSKLYGGRLVENLVQATGAAAIKYQINRLAEHVPVTMTTHDEAVFIVSETSKEWGLQLATWAFAQVPPWLVGCPLAGEAGAHQRYGEC